MDKSWMQEQNRLSSEYREGVKDFLKFAWDHANIEGKMYCPCVKCNNMYRKTKEDIEIDLVRNGIVKIYTTWHHHGEHLTYDTDDSEEASDEEGHDELNVMLEEALGLNVLESGHDDLDDHSHEEEPTGEAHKFYKILEDAKQKLYPGCEKYSRLSFIIELLHTRSLYGWSYKSFTVVIKLIKDAFPIVGETFPKSYREAKNIIKDLGLDYKKIDACPKDCMLYTGDNDKADNCLTCGASRWKQSDNESNNSHSTLSNGNKVALKTLRYFPIKPRLQRLFMSSKTAKDMTWHHMDRVNDGLLRHPADSEAWKDFDRRHPTFSSDPRNVRLGLASDGFNPFGNMSSNHSTWPVVLVTYNLPPWMCMKKPYTFLSLGIPGPKAPVNDIDVYLQPLIDELKELWNDGADTYDSFAKENVKLRAAVMWTINDFPAYANLSGWSTKGALACPCCNVNTASKRLDNEKKLCFMGHRRWLPEDHRWRSDKEHFNNEIEYQPAPKFLTGDDVLDQLQNMEQVTFGKVESSKRRGEVVTYANWKKKSIFFELPYWKTLLIRHNLDVMHIEKNVCESLVRTLLGIDKTKDNLNSRRDLEAMKIRKDLWLQDKGGRLIMPAACYTLSSKEKGEFCQFLKDVKVPDGFSSNISRCAQPKERKIINMKSHDYHVLMQRLLPLAVRGLVPNVVLEPLTELSNFFSELCSKVLNIDELECLESQIAVTLCKLERIFPPSFFDIMEHLPIHLAGEAKLAGPVQYRWNYFVERNLRDLKSYVRNRSRPEGSICEGYLAEECLTFCSRYLHDVETRFNRLERNDDHRNIQSGCKLSIFQQSARYLGKPSLQQLSQEELEQARLYVLQNCDEVLPYIEEHRQLIGNERQHKRKFAEWFEEKVSMMRVGGTHEVCEELLSLACGPSHNVRCFKGIIINGFRFHTRDRERQRKTQNSGVKVIGEGSIDTDDKLKYYGVITTIIELKYMGGHHIVLFKCDWWDVFRNGIGIIKDVHGFISLNCSRQLQTNEPFVLACQAEQVFYVRDNSRQGWCIVVKNQPRDFYNMASDASQNDVCIDGEEEPLQQNDAVPQWISVDNNDDHITWARNDIDENIAML